MGVSKKERKEARKEKDAKVLEKGKEAGWQLWLPWSRTKPPPKLVKEHAERAAQQKQHLRRFAQEMWAPVQCFLSWAAGTQVGAFLVWLVQLLVIALITSYYSFVRMAREGYAALKARWPAGEADPQARRKAEQQAREARRRQELQQRQEELELLLQLQREASMGSSPAAGSALKVTPSSSSTGRKRPGKASQPAGRMQQLTSLRRSSSGATESERSEEQVQQRTRRQQRCEGEGASAEASESEPDRAAAGYAAMLASLQQHAAEGDPMAADEAEVASATLPNEPLELGNSSSGSLQLDSVAVGQSQCTQQPRQQQSVQRQQQEEEHPHVEPGLKALVPRLESGPSTPPEQPEAAEHDNASMASSQADTRLSRQGSSRLREESRPDTSVPVQQEGTVEVLQGIEASSVQAEQERELPVDEAAVSNANRRQPMVSRSGPEGEAQGRGAQPGSHGSLGSAAAENGSAAPASATERLARVASTAEVPPQPRRPRHQQEQQQAALDVWDTCSSLPPGRPSIGRLRERGQTRGKPPAPLLAAGGIPAAAAATIAAAQRALQPGGTLAAGEASQGQPVQPNVLRVVSGKQDSLHQAQQQDRQQQQQQDDWQWQLQDQGQQAAGARGMKLQLPQPETPPAPNWIPPVPPPDVHFPQSRSAATSPGVAPSEHAATAAAPGRNGSLALPGVASGRVLEGENDLEGAVELAATLRQLSGELAGQEQQQGSPPYLRALSQQQSPAGQQQLQPHQQPEGNGHRPEVLTAFSGLANETGEYNCFLNTIVQCLFFCHDFRCEVAAWPPFLRDYNAVLRAVHGVFSALEAVNGSAAANGSMANGQHSAAGSAHGVVSANALREALSALPGQLFKAGEMNDASEVLITIYDQINKGVAAGLAFSLTLDVDLDALVGLDVREYVYCPACQLTTHSTRYTQYIYNTQATGIRDMWRAQGGGGSLGHLLRLIAEETRKSCDPDEGGCNARLPPVHALDPSRAPRIFTLQLAWESQREEAIDIAATLYAVTEVVDLAEVYSGLPPGRHLYRLRSLVCYYGAHYFAYVLLPEQQAWAKIDDTHVSKVGSWADVKRKCAAGRVQPSVLFFEAL